MTTYRYYTYKKDAIAHCKPGQDVQFTDGKGYWVHGTPTAPPVVAITMFDSVDVGQIPATAKAVAGYVNGMWPTYPKLAIAFPKAHKVSIAVNDSANADCLDVERGDALVSQAAAWVKKQHARGVKRPIIYCSVSEAKGVLDTLRVAGVPRSAIRLWTAHYTKHAHRCTSACGFGFTGTADATQYDDRYANKNLDASLTDSAFFS